MNQLVSMSNERFLKRAFESNPLLHNHARIITELSYADGKRRADIVLLNESIHAIEIKSDVDSLRNLTAQLEDYLKIFTKVSCLTTQKHFEEVRKQTPKFVGILKYKDDKIIEVRKAKKSRNLSKYHMLTLLNSKELNTFGKDLGFSISKMDIHEKRMYLSKKVSKKKISIIAGICMRNKYPKF